MERKNRPLWKKLLMIDARLPKSSYLFRAVAGLYLGYVVYQLATGAATVIPIVKVIAVAAFTIMCAVFVGSAIIAIKIGEYKEKSESNNDDENNQEK